jgi:hypothetical protein
VHTDAHAGETARAVDARAFTLGTKIVFAPGEYAPDTAAGKRLMAHELAHVMQQRGRRRRIMPYRPSVSLAPPNYF